MVFSRAFCILFHCPDKRNPRRIQCGRDNIYHFCKNPPAADKPAPSAIKTPKCTTPVRHTSKRAQHPTAIHQNVHNTCPPYIKTRTTPDCHTSKRAQHLTATYRKKLVATVRRRERIYKRTAEPSVTFFGNEEQDKRRMSRVTTRDEAKRSLRRVA